MTRTGHPAASQVTGPGDAGQMPRLQAYLARHPGTEFGLAEGEIPGVQVTIGGSRLIIHHSLKALLDKLEKHEQDAAGGGEPS